jgi:outer membrane protein OmpA-like peptidoglycan-associated protein
MTTRRRGHRQVGLALVAVLLAGTGCASRGWVEERLAERDQALHDRVRTLEATMAEQRRQASEAEQRLEARAALVEGSVREATAAAARTQALAEEAAARAETAGTRAEEADARATRLWALVHQRTAVDTVEIRFGFDQWEIDEAGRRLLDRLVERLRADPALAVEIAGYTDASGPRAYNVVLSQLRADAVRRYLVAQGLEMPRVHAVGLGPLPEAPARQERARQRRATVTVTAPRE